MIHHDAASFEGSALVTPNQRSAARSAATLLLGQFIAMWTAFFILAPAINWPASLDEPPAIILPLINAQSTAVFLGYLSYMVHALLLIPTAALLPAALGMTREQGSAAAIFGALAGFAKALGISRWLFVMPGLAAAYAGAGTTAEMQTAIGVVYLAFNAYAGGIGEILGVGLFAGTWTLIIATALYRSGARTLAIAGLGASLLLLATLPSVIGIESPILLTVSGIAWQFWTLALAIWLWRRR